MTWDAVALVFLFCLFVAMLMFGPNASPETKCKESGGTLVTPLDSPGYCIEGSW